MNDMMTLSTSAAAQSLSDRRAEALATLSHYLEFFPQEQAVLAPLQALLLDEGSSPFSRSSMQGHITTSAVVLSPDRHLLMIHHRVYDRWLPPGGHYEPPGTLWQSAAREVYEETGVCGLQPISITSGEGIVPLRIHLDCVPARPEKKEGPHPHYDFRYLAFAEARGEITAQIEEVHGVKWVALEDFAAWPEADMRSLYQKLERFLASR